MVHTEKGTSESYIYMVQKKSYIYMVHFGAILIWCI
jgi:hypothetical protein